MAVATYSEMIKGLHTFTYEIDRAEDSKRNEADKKAEESNSAKNDHTEKGQVAKESEKK